MKMIKMNMKLHFPPLIINMIVKLESCVRKIQMVRQYLSVLYFLNLL